MSKVLFWLLSWFVRLESPEKRTAYRLTGVNWVETPVRDLMPNDVVRMPGFGGNITYAVTSLPYMTEQGWYWCWGFDFERIPDPRP